MHLGELQDVTVEDGAKQMQQCFFKPMTESSNTEELPVETARNTIEPGEMSRVAMTERPIVVVVVISNPLLIFILIFTKPGDYVVVSMLVGTYIYSVILFIDY